MNRCMRLLQSSMGVLALVLVVPSPGRGEGSETTRSKLVGPCQISLMEVRYRRVSNLDHEFLSNAGWSVLLSIRNPSDKPVELKLAPESMIMKGKNGDRIATANMETGYIGAGILARKMDEGAKKITQNTGFDGEGADMSIVTEYFADKMLLKNRIASSFSQITLFNEEGQPSALLACSGQCTLKLPPGEVANLPIMFFAKEGTKPHSVTVEKVLFDNFGELVR